MQSRTDQVHSYQFFLQRVISGLVAKESDPAELPFRRLGWSGFGSIMVAVLITAGFGIYGILVGGGATSWQDGGSVIVEKETGTPYVYQDERLYPMVNFVSARLALAGAGVTGVAGVVRVSARSLAGVPRGPTLGIAGGPEALPDDGDLVTAGWSLCSELVPDGTGDRVEQSVLGVGEAASGGAPLSGEQAVLVRDGSGEGSELHLVWQGHRFALPRAEPALHALGAGLQRALPVAPVWLDTLPVGEPLAPPLVGDLGEPTTALGELPDDREIRTGQVIESAGRHFLVRSVELVEITPLQRDIALADRETRAAYPDGVPEVVRVTPAAMANAHVEPAPEPTPATAPPTRPELVSMPPEAVQDGAVCALFAPGQFTPDIAAGARLDRQRAAATSQRAESGLPLADRVLVDGGAAALVQAVPSPDAPGGSPEGGSLHLVTDQGIRYGLPRPDVASVLGYDRLGNLVQVPATLVARLPEGPALDPAAAMSPPGIATTAQGG